VSAVQVKSFNTPDEQRTPPSTAVDVVSVDGHTIARFTFQPGWRWSQHVAPVVGTTCCQALHVGAVQSGTMHIVAADGTESQVTVGDAYTIAPGHDAWTVGDQPCVVVEFQSGATYATPQQPSRR